MENSHTSRPDELPFFRLTFLISWSGIAGFALFTGMPAPEKVFTDLAPLAMLPLVVGPALTAILLKARKDGRTGIRELFSPFFQYKAGIQWYALALLMLPLLAGGVLLLLSRFSASYLPDIITSPDKAALLLRALLIGIFLTLLEEIGWSGYAVPELRKKHSWFTSGLIVGVLWGAWHFLPVLYGCGDTQGRLLWEKLYPGLFFHYAGLVPFRILMVWVQEKTQGALLPWFMHITLTAGTFFIFNIPAVGLPLLWYYLGMALGLWTLVGVVMLFEKGKKKSAVFD